MNNTPNTDEICEVCKKPTIPGTEFDNKDEHICVPVLVEQTNTDSTLRKKLKSILVVAEMDKHNWQDMDGYFNVTIDAVEALIALKVQEAEESKNNAYWERNQLVKFLTTVYPDWSHMVRHPDSDKEWEDDWRWIVCIDHKYVGQMTWHIHDSDVPTFGHLLVEPDVNHWDGHTTKEKYNRLSALQKTKGEV